LSGDALSGVVQKTGCGGGSAGRTARSSARGVPRSKGSAGGVSLAGGGERGAGLCFLGAAGCCAAGVDMLAGCLDCVSGIGAGLKKGIFF